MNYRTTTGPGLQTGEFPVCQIYSQAIPSPAAGADFSVTIPGDGGIRELISIRARLVTSATVANRLVHAVVKDNEGVEVFRVGADLAFTAGKTVVFCFSPAMGGIDGGVTTNNDMGYPMPEGPYLPNWTVGSITGAIDTGDQWSVIGVWWKAYYPDYDSYPGS